MKCARAGCLQTYEGDAWFCWMHANPQCGQHNVAIPTTIRTTEALRAVTGLPRAGEWVNRSVEACELSVRTKNCLFNAGVRTLGDVVESWRVVIRQYMFGRKSAHELISFLTALGREDNRHEWQAML